jgi:hypothetical protein
LAVKISTYELGAGEHISIQFIEQGLDATSQEPRTETDLSSGYSWNRQVRLAEFILYYSESNSHTHHYGRETYSLPREFCKGLFPKIKLGSLKVSDLVRGRTRWQIRRIYHFDSVNEKNQLTQE